MVYIKHHHCYVRVLIVEFSTLVHELCLDLDDAVEGLVGDKSLVPNVQLEHGCRMCSVNNRMILPCPGARVSQVQELTAVELQAVRACNSMYCENIKRLLV